MRKFIFIFLVAGFLSAQEAVIYQNTYLTPDRKSEQKLVQGVKMHNAQFHNGPKAKAALYYIISGPKSGKYAWIDGPMNYSEMDGWPDKNHSADWQKNISNYVTNEESSFAKLNWDASYSPKTWENSGYLLIRYFKVKHMANSRQKLMEAITKIKETLVKMNAEHPRRVYTQLFRSENGEDISLVYPFKSYERFENSNGLPPNFSAEYDKMNGNGSFRSDVGDIIQMYSDGWYDEVRVLMK